MANHSRQIVQKLWNYCNVLRDDGLSYGDYVEQLTYLLFLKMAHEPPVETRDSLISHPGRYFEVILTNPPFGKKSSVLVVNEEGEQDRQALEDLRAALEQFEAIQADLAAGPAALPSA
jgi:type I restriction-modification system DNA methylase subunit